MKKPNIIKEKTYQFAIDIVQLYKKMQHQNEYVISRQIVRSGTSIGANVEEATAAQSKKDFIAKMTISSKEARETNYWLRLTLGREKILGCVLNWFDLKASNYYGYGKNGKYSKYHK